MPPDDEARWAELMNRAQSGDAEAYRRLLAELGDAIAAYLLVRFGPVRFAEDCVQECLLAIHEARHTFRPRSPFRPWLFAIVRHKAIDMLRRQRAHRDLFRDDAADLAAQVPAPDGDPLTSLGTGQILQSLRAQHREALLLTKVMGFSIAEAAARLGISEPAMKLRVHRATRAAARALTTEAE